MGTKSINIALNTLGPFKYKLEVPAHNIPRALIVHDATTNPKQIDQKKGSQLE